MLPGRVLDFWFHEIDRALWFRKDPQFDQQIRDRFGITHQQASHGALSSWRVTLDGRLAEIIVLDQFSRNLFRDDPRAFAQDSLALKLAQEAVALPESLNLPTERKAFLYMPFMHSESLKAHEEAIKLFSQPGLEYNLKFEMRHYEIIKRFGRYPHRNQILGRPSSPEEIEFLKTPGSSF